jgi:hypothetical protein
LEKGITYILLFFLIFLTGQYDFLILSSLAIVLFFIYSPSWWNILIFGAYFFATMIYSLPSNIASISIIILFVVMLIFNLKNRNKSESAEDGGGDIDFSKLFGGGA